jgi:hypothetical protein
MSDYNELAFQKFSFGTKIIFLLATCLMLFGCLAYSSVGAMCSSETSVDVHWTKRRNIPIKPFKTVVRTSDPISAFYVQQILRAQQTCKKPIIIIISTLTYRQFHFGNDKVIWNDTAIPMKFLVATYNINIRTCLFFEWVPKEIVVALQSYVLVTTQFGTFIYILLLSHVLNCLRPIHIFCSFHYSNIEGG